MNENFGPLKKRPREVVQQACHPCRRSKRKCNGLMPCETCRKYSRNCTYEASSTLGAKGSHENQASLPFPHKQVSDVSRRPLKSYAKLYVQSNRHQDSESDNSLLQYNENCMEPMSKVISNEDIAERSSLAPRYATPEDHLKNSSRGNVFTNWISQEVGENISIHGRAWNLGLTDDRQMFRLVDIKKVLSQAHTERLSLSFFDIVHPIYSIVDKKSYTEKLALVYSDQPFEYGDGFQLVIFGVIALGSLFSRGKQIVPSIVDRRELERLLIHTVELRLYRVSSSGLKSNNLNTLRYLQAWILYLVYLRAAANPSAMWMTSSQALQYAELVGLPTESRWKPGYEQDMSRRVFWYLKSLNYMTSIELGLPEVQHNTIRSRYPDNKNDANDCIHEYLELYRITESTLVPNSGAKDISHGIRILEKYIPSNQHLSLERSYLAIIFFRRLYSLKYSFVNDITPLLLNVAVSGLDACCDFARNQIPWWHVANLPFQLLCMLLIIDSKKSITLVDKALKAIVLVSQNFETKEITDTVNTAYNLVTLMERRKFYDYSKFQDLVKSLKKSMNSQDHEKEDVPQPEQQYAEYEENIEVTSPELEFQSINDLLSDMLFAHRC